jgi:NAD(P)-dependent dehydrogenase (short-subunit alcohol dehydrogenase family)
VPDEGRLAGKVALVTGGSRGNGRAIALALAREGATLAVNYVHHSQEADQVAQSIRALGKPCLTIRADVLDSTEVQAMVDHACRELGGIDILVNNAGVLKRTPFLDISAEEWDKVLDINLRAYFVVGQIVARKMVAQGGGAIINISSVGQSLAGRALAHYCVSKAGVGMLTKAMALELAPYGIRVNAVCPGTVITDLNRNDASRPEWVESQLARLAVPRLGNPEDVAGAVVFLAADQESRMAIGTSIYLDSGKSIW